MMRNKEEDKKLDFIIKGCFIMMILGFIELFITLFLIPSDYWSVVGLFFILIAVLVLTYKIQKDEKDNLDKYADKYEKKLKCLYDLLREEYEICSVAKIDELIKLYQRLIDGRNAELKKKNAIMATIFSAVGTILAYENLNNMGIQLADWLAIVVVVLFVVGLFAFIMYSETFFDTMKKEYLAMIKELEEVRFKWYLK